VLRNWRRSTGALAGGTAVATLRNAKVEGATPVYGG
jgi:hypothetical protein